jgi:hypothetical protein
MSGNNVDSPTLDYFSPTRKGSHVGLADEISPPPPTARPRSFPRIFGGSRREEEDDEEFQLGLIDAGRGRTASGISGYSHSQVGVEQGRGLGISMPPLTIREGPVTEREGVGRFHGVDSPSRSHQTSFGSVYKIDDSDAGMRRPPTYSSADRLTSVTLPLTPTENTSRRESLPFTENLIPPTPLSGTPVSPSFSIDGETLQRSASLNRFPPPPVRQGELVADEKASGRRKSS